MVKPIFEKVIHVPADSVELEGVLTVPHESQEVIVFANGSGSRWQSNRNEFVARLFRKAGMGTFLFDLLTTEEKAAYKNHFDIDLLSGRLKAVTLWLWKKSKIDGLKIGYFGASTGAAAALKAASDLGSVIRAVVSHGGRPDLAKKALKFVYAPTLLIVGGNDRIVIPLNRESLKLIAAENEMKIIPDASHLFEEPGKLDTVARMATEWFMRYLI